MALVDFNSPSLNYVYRMTWAEFRLRLIAFNRVEERKAYMTRRICWTNIISNTTKKDLKGLTESKWWPIGEETNKPKVSEAHREAFLEATRKYLAKKKNGRT